MENIIITIKKDGKKIKLEFLPQFKEKAAELYSQIQSEKNEEKVRELVQDVINKYYKSKYQLNVNSISTLNIILKYLLECAEHGDSVYNQSNIFDAVEFYRDHDLKIYDNLADLFVYIHDGMDAYLKFKDLPKEERIKLLSFVEFKAGVTIKEFFDPEYAKMVQEHRKFLKDLETKYQNGLISDTEYLALKNLNPMELRKTIKEQKKLSINKKFYNWQNDPLFGSGGVLRK